jgi:hypothetical protein
MSVPIQKNEIEKKQRKMREKERERERERERNTTTEQTTEKHGEIPSSIPSLDVQWHGCMNSEEQNRTKETEEN